MPICCISNQDSAEYYSNNEIVYVLADQCCGAVPPYARENIRRSALENKQDIITVVVGDGSTLCSSNKKKMFALLGHEGPDNIRVMTVKEYFSDCIAKLKTLQKFTTKTDTETDNEYISSARNVIRDISLLQRVCNKKVMKVVCRATPNQEHISTMAKNTLLLIRMAGILTNVHTSSDLKRNRVIVITDARHMVLSSEKSLRTGFYYSIDFDVRLHEEGHRMRCYISHTQSNIIAAASGCEVGGMFSKAQKGLLCMTKGYLRNVASGSQRCISKLECLINTEIVVGIAVGQGWSDEKVIERNIALDTKTVVSSRDKKIKFSLSSNYVEFHLCGGDYNDLKSVPSFEDIMKTLGSHDVSHEERIGCLRFANGETVNARGLIDGVQLLGHTMPSEAFKRNATSPAPTIEHKTSPLSILAVDIGLAYSLFENPSYVSASLKPTADSLAPVDCADHPPYDIPPTGPWHSITNPTTSLMYAAVEDTYLEPVVRRV